MIKVNFDGACGPINPGGRCSGGAVILSHGYEIKAELSQEYTPIMEGDTSNNVGEYFGLLIALQYLINNGLQDEEIIVEGDSSLVIAQMKGVMRIKSGIYRPLAIRAKELVEKFSNIRFKWIPRSQNMIADELSKKAIRSRSEIMIN